MKIVIETVSDDDPTLVVSLYPVDGSPDLLVYSGYANDLSEVEATVEKLLKSAKYI